MIQRGQTTHFYLAEVAETVVGCAAIGSDDENTCGIYSFYVLPSYQGHGIGQKLMKALEADEDYEKPNRILLHASHTALGFYQKMGFVFLDGCGMPDKDGLYCMVKAKDSSSF